MWWEIQRMDTSVWSCAQSEFLSLGKLESMFMIIKHIRRCGELKAEGPQWWLSLWSGYPSQWHIFHILQFPRLVIGIRWRFIHWLVHLGRCYKSCLLLTFAGTSGIQNDANWMPFQIKTSFSWHGKDQSHTVAFDFRNVFSNFASRYCVALVENLGWKTFTRRQVYLQICLLV